MVGAREIGHIGNDPSHFWLASSYRFVVQGAPGQAAIELRGTGATSIFYLNPMGSER